MFSNNTNKFLTDTIKNSFLKISKQRNRKEYIILRGAKRGDNSRQTALYKKDTSAEATGTVHCHLQCFPSGSQPPLLMFETPIFPCDLKHVRFENEDTNMESSSKT